MISDGSSSGSAVAVSANIVPLSFGTETDTSIIGPASINGIVGIKPTVGLTSRSGVIPISASMDTVGSFGRTVSDAVQGLNAIVGQDERDVMTCTPSRPQNLDYSTSLATKESLKGAKFGLPIKRCWDQVSDGRKEAALRIFAAIREAGGDVIDTDFPCADDHIPADGGWDWSAPSLERDSTQLNLAGNTANRHSLSLPSSKWRLTMGSTHVYQSFLALL